VADGELAPGTRLPSIVDLAGQYEVAIPTVRKALAVLKAEGLVTGVAGYGTFIAEE
jgi:GntR family transcriptional regulator